MRHPCIVEQDTNKHLRLADEACTKEEWINDKAEELVDEYTALIKNFYNKDAEADAFFSELMELADVTEVDRMIRTAYSSYEQGRNFWQKFVDGLIEKRAMLDAELALEELKKDLD